MEASTKKTFSCGYCDSELGSRQTLLRHKKRKHPLELEKENSTAKKPLICKDCDFRCLLIKKLIQHYKQHGRKLHIYDKSFASEKAFVTWKKNVEKQTKSLFVLHRGKRETQTTFVKYFYCHRSGFFVPTGKGKRIRLKMTSKINYTCAAYIRVEYTKDSGAVEIEFCLDHTHNCDSSPDHCNSPTEMSNRLSSSIAIELKKPFKIEVMEPIEFGIKPTEEKYLQTEDESTVSDSGVSDYKNTTTLMHRGGSTSFRKSKGIVPTNYRKSKVNGPFSLSTVNRKYRGNGSTTVGKYKTDVSAMDDGANDDGSLMVDGTNDDDSATCNNDGSASKVILASAANSRKHKGNRPFSLSTVNRKYRGNGSTTLEKCKNDNSSEHKNNGSAMDDGPNDDRSVMVDGLNDDDSLTVDEPNNDDSATCNNEGSAVVKVLDNDDFPTCSSDSSEICDRPNDESAPQTDCCSAVVIQPNCNGSAIYIDGNCSVTVSGNSVLNSSSFEFAKRETLKMMGDLLNIVCSTTSPETLKNIRNYIKAAHTMAESSQPWSSGDHNYERIPKNPTDDSDNWECCIKIKKEELK